MGVHFLLNFMISLTHATNHCCKYFLVFVMDRDVLCQQVTAWIYHGQPCTCSLRDRPQWKYSLLNHRCWMLIQISLLAWSVLSFPINIAVANVSQLPSSLLSASCNKAVDNVFVASKWQCDTVGDINSSTVSKAYDRSHLSCTITWQQPKSTPSALILYSRW